MRLQISSIVSIIQTNMDLVAQTSQTGVRRSSGIGSKTVFIESYAQSVQLYLRRSLLQQHGIRDAFQHGWRLALPLRIFKLLFEDLL